MVPTRCDSGSAERHGSADHATTPPWVWCRRAASPGLQDARVLRTMPLHRHGCGADALPLRVCRTPRFCGPCHYSAPGVVPTRCLSGSAERHGSANHATKNTYRVRAGGDNRAESPIASQSQRHRSNHLAYRVPLRMQVRMQIRSKNRTENPPKIEP